MGKKLTGKVALVTGASKGIGASIADYLADEGASVVVNYSTSKEGADRVVEEIVKKGGKAVAVQGDFSKPDQIGRVFQEAKKTYGKIDILVNNAGIYEFAPLTEVTPEHYHKMFDLNVMGLILASREALKLFPSSGGNIINISSIASTSRLPNGTVYCATKAAVDSVTRTLATELGPRKIRVNSINPGVTITEGVKSMNQTGSDFAKEAEGHTPLGRAGLPKDIAPAVVFLASDDSGWITGETIAVSGGLR
jgi:3-oxoacyl-[acyl-carrier protein] reductase